MEAHEKHRSASLLHPTPMATPQPGGSDRRPPPLRLRGLSWVAFQPRSPPPPGVVPPPPLGLTGRASMQSFSLGTARFETHPSPTTLPRRRVGLTRPSRPPAPNEAGSSNWSSSIGEAGTGSGGIGRSTFVGFNLMNGSGGISFGGGGGISFGGGGSESLGFTFSTGAGGNRREGSSHGGSTEGTGIGFGGHNGQNMMNGENTTVIGGNEGTIGYRGVGYNPNFAHADEYPPSQEHVQTQKEPLDLNVMSNKETRTHYRTDEKRHIYSEILARNGRGNRLKHGVSKAVALACECPRRIVQRVWQQAKNGGGITGVKNNRKLKSGRKKINLNIDALEAIPPGERTTLEQVAGHLNMSTTTVWRRLKMKEIRRITSELKPALTDANQRARLEYALMHLKRCSITALGGINPTFRADMDVVNQSLAEYPHQRLNRIWLSHQACMREIIKRKGSIHYAVPHLKKKALERQGLLPVRLTIDREYVEQAIEYLNST